MSTSVSDKDGQVEQGSSLYAALARTLTRSLALYFSRPVRIFKPSKGESLIILYCIQKDQTNIIILRLVSGWMFLRSLASQNGGSLSPEKQVNNVGSIIQLKRTLQIWPRGQINPLDVVLCELSCMM